MKKRDESKVVGVVYFCDNLKKEIVSREIETCLTASSQECDLCGTHGEINFYVTDCKCGKVHDIEISSW